MDKFHYYLMSGIVRFEVKGETHTVALNTLLENDNQNIIMKDIGQTQQAMQIRFFREVMPPSADIAIKDVFIQSISYLGHMTKEEFNIQPESMPSDTKPAQTTVEGTSKPVGEVLGTSAQVVSEEPPVAVPEPIPAEPSNEADRG